MKSVLSHLCSCERTNFKQSKSLFILIINTESQLTYATKYRPQLTIENVDPCNTFYYQLIENVLLFRTIYGEYFSKILK
jgi:hypothetical protein